MATITKTTYVVSNEIRQLTGASGTSYANNYVNTIELRLKIVQTIDTTLDNGTYTITPEMRITQSDSQSYPSTNTITLDYSIPNQISLYTPAPNSKNLLSSGQTSAVNYTYADLGTWKAWTSPNTPQAQFDVPQRGRPVVLTGQIDIYSSGNLTISNITFTFNATITTETLEKTIQNPVYVFPNANIIDSTQPNIFSCVFKGEKAETAKIIIYDTNNEIKYTSRNFAFYSPIYNNDEINLSLDVSSVNPNPIPNGGEYFWKLLLSKEPVEDFELNPKFESVPYSFKTLKAPTLTFNITNGTYNSQDEAYKIENSIALNLTATYLQEQGVALQYYRFIFRNQDGELLADTDNVYSSDIKFDYDFLESQEIYSLEYKLETQEKQQLSGSINIIADYEKMDFPLNVVQKQLDNSEGILLSWEADTGSAGKITSNDYEVIKQGNEDYIALNKCQLYYDEIEGNDLVISENNFGFSLQVELNTSDLSVYASGTDRRFNIASLQISSELSYAIFIKNYEIFLSKNENGEETVSEINFSDDTNNILARIDGQTWIEGTNESGVNQGSNDPTDFYDIGLLWIYKDELDNDIIWSDSNSVYYMITPEQTRTIRIVLSQDENSTPTLFTEVVYVDADFLNNNN